MLVLSWAEAQCNGDAREGSWASNQNYAQMLINSRQEMWVKEEQMALQNFLEPFFNLFFL